MNIWLGNTEYYQHRIAIFSDLDVSMMLIELINGSTKMLRREEGSKFNLKEGWRFSDPSYQKLEIEKYTIDDSCELSDDQSALISMCLLLLNYTCLKPCRYTEKLMLKNNVKILEFLDLIMSKGGRKMKLLALKWISSVCRDNFGFLMDLPKDFIDFVFSLLSKSLNEQEWEYCSLLIDILQILMTYRSKIISENTKYLCEKILELKSEPDCPITELLLYLLPELLRESALKIKKSMMTFGEHRWESFYSKQMEFYEMTSEKNPNFKVLMIDDRIIIGWKFLKLYEQMSSVELQSVKELLR